MKKVCAIFSIIAIAVALISCDMGVKKYHKTYYGDFFDTVCEIIVYAPSDSVFNEILNDIERELLKYHKLLDIYNSYSDICNVKTINDNAGISPVTVSKEMIDILEFCIYAHEVTCGKTNVMMGPVVTLWNECRDKNDGHIPENDALIALDQYTDISLLEVNREDMTAYISKRGASLDVGSIAKGYVAEKIANLIYDRDIAACINLGGNVKLVKSPPYKIWTVGIKDPFGSSSRLKLDLDDGYSVVTSGAYERYFYADGHRYNHVIDSDTLYPSEYFESVSVISRDSAICDMLSTALLCMSKVDGEELLSEFDDAYAIWIYSDGTCEYSDGTGAILK